MIASELRHGNWIETYSGKQQVIDIMCDSINTCNHEGLPYEEVFGITLTEEVLLKCEWQLVKNNTYYINSYFSIDGVGHLYYMGDYTGINILFVHQLQNVCYFIEGKELNIDL